MAHNSYVYNGDDAEDNDEDDTPQAESTAASHMNAHTGDGFNGAGKTSPTLTNAGSAGNAKAQTIAAVGAAGVYAKLRSNP